MKIDLKRFILLGICTALMACGGGESGANSNPNGSSNSGSSSTSTGGASSSSTASSGGGNPSSFTGRLYMEAVPYNDGGSDIHGWAAYDPNEHTLTLIASTEGIGEFAISDDATKLAVISSSGSQLAVVDESNPSLPIIQDTSTSYGLPIQFSPTAHSIAYKVDELGYERMRTRNQNGEQYEITRDDLEAYTDRSRPLSWDWLDEKSMVFSAESTIFIINDIADKNYFNVLRAFSNVDIGNIVVSHDRTKIAFTQATPSQTIQAGDVYIMDIDSSNLKQLTQGYPVRDLAWSPDDKYLAFIVGSSRNAGTDITFSQGRCKLVYAVPVNAKSPASVQLEDYEPAIKFQVNRPSGLEDLCIAASSNLYWAAN